MDAGARWGMTIPSQDSHMSRSSHKNCFCILSQPFLDLPIVGTASGRGISPEDAISLTRQWRSLFSGIDSLFALCCKRVNYTILSSILYLALEAPVKAPASRGGASCFFAQRATPQGSPAVLEKLGACHHRNGLGTSAHSQLAINTAHLGLYRVEGDNEGLCNLSVGASSDEQA